MPSGSDNNQDQLSENLNEGTLNNGKMYMELLDDKTKACLQTQELKLMGQDEDMEQFVFMCQEEAGLGLDNAVITKQNSDGTISLTSVKGNKLFIIYFNYKNIFLYIQESLGKKVFTEDIFKNEIRNVIFEESFVSKCHLCLGSVNLFSKVYVLIKVIT